METPLYDFVARYRESGTVRAHMPGHKGVARLGPEPMDITEIKGADSLFEDDGVLLKSEENAASLFGSRLTCYSTEGASLCIRAMAALALTAAPQRGRPFLLAGRNAHRSLLTAAALLDFDIRFLDAEPGSYVSGRVSPDAIRAALQQADTKPFAVYLTSPDYLGGMTDVASAARVCHGHGVPLLVDNAHGAYLKFLQKPMHPLDLGADLCCDSAHKTLPVLTGGAYLHANGGLLRPTREDVKEKMALFASTSPSYLTLLSLDLANRRLADDFSARLQAFVATLDQLKADLKARGWTILAGEPLKLTLRAPGADMTGLQVAERLRAAGIECEYADPDYTVMMLGPDNDPSAIGRIRDALLNIRADAHGEPLPVPPPATDAERVLTIRQAMLCPAETVPLEKALGRVLASPSVACPPAVPIAVCGERIREDMLRLFRYYGVRQLRVCRA